MSRNHLNSEAFRQEEAAMTRRLDAEAAQRQPCRNQTQLCDTLGECLRCGASSGEYRCTAPRGPGYQIGHDNRENVRAYFLSHIGATNQECAATLGLSVMAVGRHIKTLRAEWAV